MTERSIHEAEVLDAAANLVAAFARFDKDAYFATFRPDASFIFYNSPDTFADRAAYERAWDEWVADGWRVLDCASTGAEVRLLDETTAIFTHDVSTTLATGATPTALHERESILFVKGPSGWLAVHEHLSPFPD
jgi:ketosteroid isomerase-like protein